MEGEILAARFGPMLEKYSLKLVAIEVGSEISSPLLLKQEGQVSLDLRLLSISFTPKPKIVTVKYSTKSYKYTGKIDKLTLQS